MQNLGQRLTDLGEKILKDLGEKDGRIWETELPRDLGEWERLNAKHQVFHYIVIYCTMYNLFSMLVSVYICM